MTETEWNSSENITAMLAFANNKVSDRTAALFLCALCRLNWYWLYSAGSRHCVEVVERYVDGGATEFEVFEAGYRAEAPTFGHDFSPTFWRARGRGEVPPSVRRLVEMGVFTEQDLKRDHTPVAPEVVNRLYPAMNVVYQLGCALENNHTPNLEHPDVLGLAAIPETTGSARSVLRGIFGPHLFRAVTADPAWQTPQITTWAQGIYEKRTFDELPVLGDLFEEVGCTQPDMLHHCREPGPHARGCWVIDLFLGKQ